MRIDSNSIQISKCYFLFLFFHFPLLIFNTEEDGNNISITLPPSQHRRTVTVTKGHQAANHVCIIEDPTTGPPALVFLSQLSTGPDIIAENTSPSSDIMKPDDEIKTQEADDDELNVRTPVAQRTVEDLSIAPSLAVDVETIGVGMDTLILGTPDTNQEPPIPSLPAPPSHLRECPPYKRFHVSKEVIELYPPWAMGWRSRSWVVVIRGREIGVFHEFWYA
jgi:hypothetical protein